MGSETTVRLVVMGRDAELRGEAGTACVGYRRTAEFGVYRWLLNLPNGEGVTYFRQRADWTWKEVLSAHLSILWDRPVRIIGDDLTPGPAPRAPGLVGP